MTPSQAFLLSTFVSAVFPIKPHKPVHSLDIRLFFYNKHRFYYLCYLFYLAENIKYQALAKNQYISTSVALLKSIKLLKEIFKKSGKERLFYCSLYYILDSVIYSFLNTVMTWLFILSIGSFIPLIFAETMWGFDGFGNIVLQVGFFIGICAYIMAIISFIYLFVWMFFGRVSLPKVEYSS